jgi:hypothetical protein
LSQSDTNRGDEIGELVHDSAGAIKSIERRLHRYQRYVVTLSLLFVAVAFGCGERNSPPKMHESNLRVVAVLYSQFVSAHAGEIPRDADDFGAFVQSLGPGVLERAGFSGLNELLLSRRDGKPFAIHFKNVDWKIDHVIAHEQDGADGTRCIVSDLGAVSEITERQFQSRLNGSL